MQKKWLSRRQLISHSATLAVGGLAGWALHRSNENNTIPLPEELILAGQDIITNSTVVDLHSHPGRFFLNGADTSSWKVKLLASGFEDDRILDMKSAHVTASMFAIVADIAVLDFKDGGIIATRDFNPGEAYADYQRQLKELQHMSDAGLIKLALSPADIVAAQKQLHSVALLSCEGADFVEDKLERLAQAYDAGLRSISLVHYRVNALADNQTSPPVHGGLSKLGKDVVSEMNRQGLIIDLAHASQAACADTMEISSAPVMVSHSNLLGSVSSPRFLNKEHAHMIAANGGLVGAWPSGLDSKNLWDFAHQVLRLVEEIGVDHVAIGTDMDGNYKPVLRDYADFSTLASMLLYRGLNADDCQKIFGANFLRLFSQVQQQRTA